MSQRIGTKLFVNRLSFYTTQEQLKTLFSPFGKVTKVDLVIDPRTKRPKGFGFVSYDSEIEAERAMKAMNGRCCVWFRQHRYHVSIPRSTVKLLLVASKSQIVNARLILVEPANDK